MSLRREQLLKPCFGSSSALNSTVLDTSTRPTSFIEESLDKLQLKSNYDECHTAHLKALNAQRHIEQAEEAAIEQLSVYLQKLTSNKVEEYNLETQIRVLERQNVLNIDADLLRTQLGESINILNAQVLQQIDLITILLDSASNKLYLHNFHAIDGQDSYDALEKMIATSTTQVKKLLQLAGNIDGLNELRKGLEALKEKQCMVDEYCKKFEDAEHLIVASTLRKISDMLAEELSLIVY